MRIIKFAAEDILELKKAHPCGSKLFRVVRVGSDVRIICTGCGHDMTLDRIKLEKSIKKVFSANKPDEEQIKNDKQS